jgi:predicted 2-oxoglutarate/Fe(II)-dependent dioxygenase YbiX
MRYNWFYVNNFFSKKEIEDVNKICNQKKFLPMGSADTKKTSVAKGITASNLSPFASKLEELTNYINVRNYGFHLYPTAKDDFISYNVYKKGAQYDWHYDGEKNEKPYEIKMTAIVNISLENYTGGDFYLFRNQERELSELSVPGNIVMFPSLYLHKVTPILTGVRTTLTFWRIGKPWT